MDVPFIIRQIKPFLEGGRLETINKKVTIPSLLPCNKIHLTD